MTNASLNALVRAAQGGDLDAFEAVMIAIDRQVRGFVAARADSHELIEEIVQAAFVTAFEQLDQWQPTGSFANWVIGIAHNHLRDELRRRRRLVGGDATAFERMVALARSGLDEPAIDERLDRLGACLDRLTPAARALIQARYGEGMDLDALAMRMQAEPNTLAVRLHRIRQSLRECIADTAKLA